MHAALYNNAFTPLHARNSVAQNGWLNCIQTLFRLSECPYYFYAQRVLYGCIFMRI